MIGGPQKLSIGEGCEHKAIVQHEIFRALGRIHEQTWPDRDQYVIINQQNIITGTYAKTERSPIHALK